MDNKDFVESYKQIAQRIILISEKARREGLLSLEEMIDEKKYKERDVFEQGILYIVDGTDAAIVDKILSNIVNQEKDESLRVLKTIQKEAVLAIQEGVNLRILKALINSYSNLTFEEDEIFKDIDH